MRIAAGILAHGEHPSMIEAALDSTDCLDNAFTFGEGEVIEDELGEARVRQIGLELAYGVGADWYLQIDADERLVRGELLYDYLGLAASPWWPLPYVQENGDVTVAPCKLIRLDARPRCYLASDVYVFDAQAAQGNTTAPTLLSGYVFPEVAKHLLEELPVLLHVPSARPDAGTRRRLSVAIEGSDQAGRIDAYKPELEFVVPRALRFPR